MDSEDRLVPLSMKATSEKIYFIDRNDQVVFGHKLGEFHAQSADSEETKAVDRTGKFFGARLQQKDGTHLKFYATGFSMMRQAIEKILQLQGFTDRRDQYEHVRDLPAGIDCERSIVRHRVTGKMFELKRSADNRGA